MKNLLSLIITVLIFFSSCTTGANKPMATENKVVATVSQQANQEAPVNNLPAFKMRAADGSVVNIADLKGKKIFINLWATWCPPCKAEIPSVESLYKKTNPDHAVFIMLSLDDNFDMAKGFAKSNKMKLPLYYPAENLPPIFMTEGIPATFIFNENGKLIKMNTGMENYNTEEYAAMFR